MAQKFHLDPVDLQDLNPTLWAKPDKILLVHSPRNAEEAVLLLEEAKRAEMLGGVGVRKATLLYRGLLEAAKLIPSETASPRIVEMPSDVVAQALLGWGKIHESKDPNQAQWAYRQVRVYFPDRTDYLSQATDRLAQMEAVEGPPVIPGPESGLQWFPFSPHILVDIDAERLERELRNLNLVETFDALAEHPNERVRRRYEGGREKWEETLRILSHMKSVHIGGWVDPEIYGHDPEEGLRESRWLIVGQLKSSFEEFSQGLDLPSATETREGFSLHDIGGGSVLASNREQVLVGKQRIVDRVIAEKPPFNHPRLSSPESGYQRARYDTGAGSAVFGYFDLEGFLQGPALAFARNGNPEDREAVFISLLLSGLIGVHSIEGLAFSLDSDHDALSVRASLRHGGGGILNLFAGDPCPERTLRFFPQRIHGFLQLRRPCTPAVNGLLDLRLDSFLGFAAPVYRAHYERFLEMEQEEEGLKIDPLVFLESGMLDEISVGLEIPSGMVPLPNLLIAAPTSLASPEFKTMETYIERDEGVQFSEDQINGHWIRHTLIPIESPLFLNLSYTLHEGTLLLASNPELIGAALENEAVSPRLETDSDFREFRQEWFPNSHLSLYLSKTLTTRLARLGRVSVTADLESPLAEPFARIFQSQMDALVEDSHFSGLGVRLGENGVHGHLLIRPFKAWFSALLSMRWMNKVEEWAPES
ncbi:MAG: hypothetical protein H6752_06015 [Candidatus Omnitrophica bacterium]|nr:hypothetical protein [Candidatus Omnitrophota bacterium]